MIVNCPRIRESYGHVRMFVASRISISRTCRLVRHLAADAAQRQEEHRDADGREDGDRQRGAQIAREGIRDEDDQQDRVVREREAKRQLPDEPGAEQRILPIRPQPEGPLPEFVQPEESRRVDPDEIQDSERQEEPEDFHGEEEQALAPPAVAEGEADTRDQFEPDGDEDGPHRRREPEGVTIRRLAVRAQSDEFIFRRDEPCPHPADSQEHEEIDEDEERGAHDPFPCDVAPIRDDDSSRRIPAARSDELDAQESRRREEVREHERGEDVREPERVQDPLERSRFLRAPVPPRSVRPVRTRSSNVCMLESQDPLPLGPRPMEATSDNLFVRLG